MNDLITRFNTMNHHRAAALPLTLERGTARDYATLAHYHYQSHRLAAVTTVYRLVHTAPTVVGRYLQRSDERTIVGILIRAMPRLNCRLRDIATHNRYRDLGPRAGVALLNREMRTITRVVIHPQWRGLGLAVRLVRHALAHPETPYTEALAAMGRVNPFFERAGMVRYDRPPHEHDARLLDALAHIDLAPHHLASRRVLHERTAALTRPQRTFLQRELHRWSRARRLPRTDDLMTLLAHARDRALLQPVYYLARRAGARDAPDPLPTFRAHRPLTDSCQADAAPEAPQRQSRMRFDARSTTAAPPLPVQRRAAGPHNVYRMPSP